MNPLTPRIRTFFKINPYEKRYTLSASG
jgi:hypothetical protein